MTIVSKIAPSTDLMTGMMDRLGRTPLSATPTLADAQRLRGLVMRCVVCPDQPGCAALQSRAPELDAPPDFCPNATALMAMPRACSD